MWAGTIFTLLYVVSGSWFVREAHTTSRFVPSEPCVVETPPADTKELE